MCTWSEDPDYPGVWNTACGKSVALTNWSPRETPSRCISCGKPVVVNTKPECGATLGEGWSGPHKCKLQSGHAGKHECEREGCGYTWDGGKQ